MVLATRVRARAFILGDERYLRADERSLRFAMGTGMIQPWQAGMSPPHT